MFFHLLRLNRQVGVSPTALRQLESQIRSEILSYQEQQNQQIKQFHSSNIRLGSTKCRQL